MAELDGDGRADLGVWRPSTGEWFVRDQFTNVQWGWSEDFPATVTPNRRVVARRRAAK